MTVGFSLGARRWLWLRRSLFVVLVCTSTGLGVSVAHERWAWAAFFFVVFELVVWAAVRIGRARRAAANAS